MQRQDDTMWNTFQVDWSKSSRREISSEPDSCLPANIKSFKAAALTPEVLVRAVDLMKPPVQVVQIEITPDVELIRAARALEDVDNDDVIWNNDQLYREINSLENYFKKFLGEIDKKSAHVLERHGMNMVQSITERYGRAAVNEFMFLREETVNYENFCFHSHVWDDKHTPEGRRAFYFSQPLAEEGTYFVGVDDLDTSSLFSNVIEASFNKDNPVLWQAREGAFVLFTTKNQQQGPAFHASPPKQPSRTVAIVNFHL